MSKAPRVKHQQKPVVRRPANPRKKAAVVVASGPPARPPDGDLQSVTLASATITGSGSSSTLLSLVLLIVLGVSLAVVAIALTPPRVLPRPMGVVVYERREPLVYAGVATALGIGVGLLMTLAAS